MNKTTTEGMIKTIIWNCANFNIRKSSDIALNTGLDRGAVSRYCDLLSEIGVLIRHYRKSWTYYTLNQDIQKFLEKEGGNFIKEMLEHSRENVK